MAQSGSPSEVRGTPASGAGARGPDQTPRAHRRLVPRAARSSGPDAADLWLYPEKRRAGGSGPPLPFLSATRSERRESPPKPADAGEPGAGEAWEVPGGSWVNPRAEGFSHPLQLRQRIPVTPRGEGTRAECAPEGARSAGESAPGAVTASVCPKGPCHLAGLAAEGPSAPPSRTGAASFSTRGWTAPRPPRARAVFAPRCAAQPRAVPAAGPRDPTWRRPRGEEGEGASSSLFL